MISIYIFFICILPIIFFEFINRKSKNLYAYIIIIFFALLCGNRNLNIPDTRAYIDVFNDLNSNIFDTQYLYFETGFIYLSKIIKNIFGNKYEIYFFLIAILNLIIIYFIIKREVKLRITALVIYLCFYGLFFNFITLRAGLATSIFVLSLSIFNEKKILAIFLFLLASQFHSSVLLFFPIFFILPYISSSRYLNSIWFLIIGIIYYTKFSIIMIDLPEIVFRYLDIEALSRLKIYFENIIPDYKFSVRFTVNYIVLLFLIHHKSLNRKYQYWVGILLLGNTILSLFSIITSIERVASYLMVTSFIPSTIYLQENKKNIIRYLFLTAYIILHVFFFSRIAKV